MDRTATVLLQELFEQQHLYVNHFFENLDLMQAEKILQSCLECEGLLIFTGIGKSGIIAEKIVMTLISTGTRALYLPPMNFLHGDIGVVAPQDRIIMLSKSGETQELLELVPHLRRKGSKIIALVSDQESRLAKMADLYIHLPVEKELCPFDLAPTTSTAVQLLFGDLLAMALMREKGFSLEEYAGNHPYGSIGKKITLRVKELMRVGDDIPLCYPEDRLVDVIVDLSNKKCGCLFVVTEEKKLLGIFTDGDLRRRLQAEGARVMEKKMKDLMNPSPVTVGLEDLALVAIKKMQKMRYVMIAPVVEKEKVQGIIRMHDIVQAGI